MERMSRSSFLRYDLFEELTHMVKKEGKQAIEDKVDEAADEKEGSGGK